MTRGDSSPVGRRSTGRIEASKLLAPAVEAPICVKLIGLGGVGGIVARYGSLFLSSLSCDARLVLIDGDDFEPSNGGRMYFDSYGNKAIVIRDRLLR